MPSTQGIETSSAQSAVLFDAGVFIAALLKGDLRHAEARPLVERARRGEIPACTTPSILCEVYGALTWEKAEPPHSPAEAAQAVRLLVLPPSAIAIIAEDHKAVLRALELAASHTLTARRIHDARHAATALEAGITAVCTYDPNDWSVFQADGIQIVGPPSVLERLGRVERERSP